MERQELVKKIEDIVVSKCRCNKIFTAYDITVALRNQEGGHVANHIVIRNIIQEIFDDGITILDYDFSRQLMNLEKDGENFQAFVYYMDEVSDPYNYPLAKKDTISITNESDTGDYSNSSIIREITSEKRLNIPQQLLSMIDAAEDGMYCISFGGIHEVNKSPDVEGRVRISVDNYSPKDKVMIFADTDIDKIVVTKY